MAQGTKGLQWLSVGKAEMLHHRFDGIPLAPGIPIEFIYQNPSHPLPHVQCVRCGLFGKTLGAKLLSRSLENASFRWCPACSDHCLVLPQNMKHTVRSICSANIPNMVFWAFRNMSETFLLGATPCNPIIPKPCQLKMWPRLHGRPNLRIL